MAKLLQMESVPSVESDMRRVLGGGSYANKQSSCGHDRLTFDMDNGSVTCRDCGKEWRKW